MDGVDWVCIFIVGGVFLEEPSRGCKPLMLLQHPSVRMQQQSRCHKQSSNPVPYRQEGEGQSQHSASSTLEVLSGVLDCNTFSANALNPPRPAFGCF